jgi:adenine deaminase
MFKNTLALSLFAVLLVNGSITNAASDALRQTIYFGGDTITMEGDKPSYVEAVIERDGKIIYAGEKAGAVNNFAGKTIEVDLKGQTMMPGFIEPHAHPVSIGGFILANDIVAPHEWRMPQKTTPVFPAKRII